MMRLLLLTATALAAVSPAVAQTVPSITLYELPGYLGRSVTISDDTPDLVTQDFARRAQSARVSGSWQICPTAKYAGACRTLTGNTPLLTKSQVVSLRPTPSASSDTASSAPSSSASVSSLDLDALDVGSGTDGQDVTFFARPTLGGTEVSAGTNDLTTATAFCKLAGSSSASYAGRARVQSSNIIDVASKTKVRGFALRDVVCKR